MALPQQLFNEINVREHHAPTAISVQSNCVHGIAEIVPFSVPSRLPVYGSRVPRDLPIRHSFAILSDRSDQFDILFVEVGNDLANLPD
jgi:hypothetical protein